MIKDDLLEAVIILPSGMYAYTAIPTALLVFNKQKPKERKNKVLRGKRALFQGNRHGRRPGAKPDLAGDNRADNRLPHSVE